MKKFLLLSLMCILPLQIACTRDTEYTTEAASEAAMTDNDLESMIESRFDADPSLRDADLNIDADAERNMVTLSGEVENEAQRTMAVEQARNAHPGLIVNNQIDVEAREKTREEYTDDDAREWRQEAEGFGDKVGGTIDDAWLHTKVVTKLIGDREVSEREINVDVQNNVVTLRGTVDTQEEKMEAERLARDTEGVKSVVNQLKVVAD